MLDRSTSNLFQAEPSDASPEPPPTLFEEAGAQAAPSIPARARRQRPTFTFHRFGARLRNRIGAAWRHARYFLTPLLIVLAVYRLAAGGCSSPSAPTPNAVTPRGSSARVQRVLAKALPTKRGVPEKPHVGRAHRSREPTRANAAAASLSRVSPTPAPATIAAPPGETRAARPVAATHGEGHEFGFEH